MIRTWTLVVLAALAAVSCAPASAPAPAVVPTGADRFLVDPRAGWPIPVPPALSKRFESAWRLVVSGDEAEASRRLADILRRDSAFAPATLADAALDIRAGRLEEAREIVARLREQHPSWTAARVYEAEIAAREGRTRLAYDLYRELAASADAPPFASERVTELSQTLFNDLYAAAQAAPDPEAVRLLREALQLSPGALEARLLLARRLLAQRQFDEARRELDPILDTAAGRAEVQEMLAEIEVGRGRYEDAIVRYERLVRSSPEPRYEQRLEQIKREWGAANMPPHVRAAIESPALTRAELATLLYWTVPSVRFAQNLQSPPIAVDIEDVAGREEIIRAIAIGIYEVDPVTRRVSPGRVLTPQRLSQLLGRLLVLRGAACARGVASDRALTACGVTDPATHGGESITGREAEAILAQIAKVM